MSVICQNFVQNAWKKDLCSNCFKSVGDHENSDNGTHNENLQQDESENLNERYVSQSANIYTSRNTTTPHTTWKSLISERNSKNSQPFKLETGFQGRLLTINKASNGTEKKNTHESKISNGHVPHSVDDSSQKQVNGHLKKISGSQSESTLNVQKGCKYQNGIHLSNGNAERNDYKVSNKNEEKIEMTENKSSKGLVSRYTSEIENASKENISNQKQTQSKFTKSKSEDVPQEFNHSLHSILKKSISSPDDSSVQSRRSSNVGFNEEPLVIGYGGRDFSPEELEWEMASSDGETENALDSLDETEDDRAFSKMTQKNTEFNSDNANLLQKENPCIDKSSKEVKRTEKISNKSITKKLNCSSKISDDSTTNKSNGQTTSKSYKEQECKTTSHEMPSTKVLINEEPLSSSFNKIEICLKKNEENIDENKKKNYTNEAESSVENNSNHFTDETNVNAEASNRNIEHISIKDKNGSIKVAIKSDKTNHAARSQEVTVVGVGEATISEDVKNSTEFINGALPPSRVVSTPNIEERGETKQPDDPVMFSDGGESAWQQENKRRNAEWEGNESAMQILQAINTSLTNRHKMRESESDSEISTSLDGKTQNESSENPDTNHEAPVNIDAVKNVISTTEIISAETDSLTEEPESITVNVEPRTSFLHGIVSNDNASKPSAIYGPASDLFVSRSNSSSSSSSDELSKSESSRSINTIVNNDDNSEQCKQNQILEEKQNEKLETKIEKTSKTEKGIKSFVVNKMKPKIPAKPSKQRPCSQTYAVTNSQENIATHDTQAFVKSSPQSVEYFSSTSFSTLPDDSSRSIILVDHYAESNIYNEVNNKESKVQDGEYSGKSSPGRESKLAALAMELEQVRHTNGKRQAPAPPKIPDPPLEDPPSCTGRTSPTSSDIPHSFSTFRGETAAFSSASSTTSTSSQDTETGYASWNLHGDSDGQSKYSKSKGSFLLTQYSKCKMIAMGYAEDGVRARKKFSLKKLLKKGKDSESKGTFDPTGKAWKYNDHFERPRAKLEIIHPMDLENKSVTVNPGFDSTNTSSVSSFTASADDLSLRNSVSSDYGSYYSDTMSPAQDLKPEANYEYIQPQIQPTEDSEGSEGMKAPSSTTSPTPSRSSLASQASTLTSGSSKNGAVPPHRPPKPPPPPRAHSLLPGNKTLRNPDGTFKFPVSTEESINTDNAVTLPSKPQAPKRQCKSALLRSDYANYDEGRNVSSLSDSVTKSEDDASSKTETNNNEEANMYEAISNSQETYSENHYQDIIDNARVSDLSLTVVEEVSANQKVDTPNLEHDGQLTESQTKTSVSSQEDESVKVSKPLLSRNKHSPLTKAPARPPPIYTKPQSCGIARNNTPWKTLEDSYLAVTAFNRELIVKLVNQALKRRKHMSAELPKSKFQWADFEIDTSEPSSIFAFGEKIAYHATMPKYPECSVTLVITVQQQQNRLNEIYESKYPVFGQFTDYIPSELLDGSTDIELESMPATVLVLDRSNISTIESFTESLPNPLTEENEKELCFIILQLIQFLKSLQAQGIESMDSSFQNLILSKTKQDKFNTLVFISDNCYDENDYASDSCKISLCQYALMLIFQMLSIQTSEDFASSSATKFSSSMAKKVFETAISLLVEEKAVSLSQTKTLFECFLWDATKVLEAFSNSDDTDNILHRWLDIERANFIKNLIDEKACDINIQSEYFSQFLIRTSVRNIKDAISYL
ncbi:uncharacterized protein LOC118192455 isoform X2 [Stegodyphus dumicola]|uniref:uncharacterized protein LOC118192455 isoform X2 n=1 Tax=Stegodyphus dumicola TaxID=202533 RepID=UPI0015B0DD94|nr:uncharacterized protein LOC118192455 isoform X2 [Stegodyphus dumicola]